MNLEDDVLSQALAPVPATWEARPGLRLAAVLAPILSIDGEDHVLFTERRADLPEHPGQIAFPGGARDGVESPTECALRESMEEIGLPPSAVTILGAVANQSSSSKFRVHAIVGRVRSEITLRPDPREVESMFTVSFTELMTTSNWQSRAYRTATGWTSSTPHFQAGKHLIWGLTGRLAKDLVDTARGVTG